MAIKIENKNKKPKGEDGFQWGELLTKEITVFGNSFNNKKKNYGMRS